PELGSEDALALEELDPRVVGVEAAWGTLERVAHDRIAGRCQRRHDGFEPRTMAVVGHGPTVGSELLRQHDVRPDADEQSVSSDLQVLTAHGAGTAPAERQGRTLLVRPFVLAEAHVAVGPVDVPLPESTAKLRRQRLSWRLDVLPAALAVAR